METIEVGYYPISITGGLAYHKFIVYTQADGTSFQIHGGGSAGSGYEPLGDFILNGYGVPTYGDLTVRVFETTPNTAVSPTTNRETIFEGQDLRLQFFKLVGMAQGIAEQHTTYSALTNNSNTLVDLIIKFAGGEAPLLDSEFTSPASLDDSEFNPEFFSQLPMAEPFWGKDTYTKHQDIVHALFRECFLAGTEIMLPNGLLKPIEAVVPGDIVLSYDATGNLVPKPVTRTFRNQVTNLLDVHGLKVTPGHITLCGDGIFKNRHVPIIDIILSDGALVTSDGSLIRIATNSPVGSLEDGFVKVKAALTPEDTQHCNLIEGEVRVGTLLFDRNGKPVSILDCLKAEGFEFDPCTGLVAKPGQPPQPLFWFGNIPQPKDYILRRSQQNLEGILLSNEWGRVPSSLLREHQHPSVSTRIN